MIKYYPYLILIILLSCNNILAQRNIFKFIPGYNSDVTRNKIFEFDINSYGIGYERVTSDHGSVELIIINARMVGVPDNLDSRRTNNETKKLTGFSVESRYRYYFQTNPSFITYAPFEFYLAPTIGYTQMQTPTLNDFHEIRYYNVGAIAGFQLVFELFDEGFAVDLNTGINYISYNAKGFLNEKEISRFFPRVSLSFGYNF